MKNLRFLKNKNPVIKKEETLNYKYSIAHQEISKANLKKFRRVWLKCLISSPDLRFMVSNILILLKMNLLSKPSPIYNMVVYYLAYLVIKYLDGFIWNIQNGTSYLKKNNMWLSLYSTSVEIMFVVRWIQVHLKFM